MKPECLTSVSLAVVEEGNAVAVAENVSDLEEVAKKRVGKLNRQTTLHELCTNLKKLKQTPSAKEDNWGEHMLGNARSLYSAEMRPVLYQPDNLNCSKLICMHRVYLSFAQDQHKMPVCTQLIT